MDPLTAATTVATLVGLLSNFVSEGRARDADAWDQFRLELDSDKHQKLIDELNSNELLSRTIKQLLESQHDDLKQELEVINKSIASLVSASALREITEALSPQDKLSKQAIGILLRMEKHQATYVVKKRNRISQSKKPGYSMPGTGKMFYLDNERFAKDDFNTLVELRLLRLEYSSNGNEQFYITREASELIKSITKEEAEESTI
jgi:hypothetical protein